MKNKLELKTESRAISGKKVKEIRKEGKVPAAVYGPNLESTNITVDDREFRKIFKASGYSSLIEAQVGKDKVQVIIKEIQAHPVTREYIHVSLYAVDMTSEIETHVPLRLVGESIAVKNSIGILSMPTDRLEIRCLPADLPHEIEVDISGLSEIGDSISAGDIVLPKGVTYSSSQSEEERLVAIVPQQKEVVEEVVEETEAEEGEEGAEGEGDASKADDAEKKDNK